MLLAIDSATRMLSLALHDGQRVRGEMAWETVNNHTVELTPAIDALCTRAKISVQQLSHLAVSQGPGSFSGLRIGIGVAKGLAMALDVPLIAIPTLDIVAAAQPMFKGTLIAVAQAGRGRVCAGRYAWQRAAWSPDSDVQVIGWEALIASIDGETLLAGEIDSAARELITASPQPIRLATPALCLRRAAMLADLAWAHTDIEADPTSVIPIYVHQPGVSHP